MNQNNNHLVIMAGGGKPLLANEHKPTSETVY